MNVTENIKRTEILANDKIHTPDQVYVLQLIRNYNLHPLKGIILCMTYSETIMFPVT